MAKRRPTVECLIIHALGYRMTIKFEPERAKR